VLSAALEEVERGARVLTDRAGRIGGRAGRIRHAREMEDGGSSRQQLAHGRITRVHTDGLGLRGARRSIRPRDPHDFVAFGLEQRSGS
jgi:hypothetical protein